VRGILFKEQEGSFRSASSSQADKDNHGRLRRRPSTFPDPPLVRRLPGRRQVRQPNATVLESWGNSFNDPATSKELAAGGVRQHADYIMAAAAAGNTGVFEGRQREGLLHVGRGHRSAARSTPITS